MIVRERKEKYIPHNSQPGAGFHPPDKQMSSPITSGAQKQNYNRWNSFASWQFHQSKALNTACRHTAIFERSGLTVNDLSNCLCQRIRLFGIYESIVPLLVQRSTFGPNAS